MHNVFTDGPIINVIDKGPYASMCFKYVDNNSVEYSSSINLLIEDNNCTMSELTTILQTHLKDFILLKDKLCLWEDINTKIGLNPLSIVVDISYSFDTNSEFKNLLDPLISFIQFYIYLQFNPSLIKTTLTKSEIELSSLALFGKYNVYAFTQEEKDWILESFVTLNNLSAI